MNVRTAIGIDVGGTKIAAGIVRFPDARILARRQIPTQPERGGAAVLDDVARISEELIQEATAVHPSILALGIGLCELVSREGRILSRNCIWWETETVTRRLSSVAPVFIEADVRAAARAESAFGAGREFRSFLYVTVGTGISCCLMIDGQPYLGARGATGTLASSALGIPCERCGTVNRRTLEELASGPALVTRLNRIRPGSAGSGQDVLAAVAAGNPEARNVVQSAGEALASTVGWAVNVLDPEAVIVGGGLGHSEGYHWQEFVDSTRRYIWSEVHRDLPILRAATGGDSGIIGAAWTALQAV